MEQKFIRIVRRSGGSLCVNLPKEVVSLLNLKEGDMLDIIIKKIK